MEGMEGGDGWAFGWVPHVGGMLEGGNGMVGLAGRVWRVGVARGGCTVTCCVMAVAAADGTVAPAGVAAAVTAGVALRLWEAGMPQLCHIGRVDFLCEPAKVLAGVMSMIVEHGDGAFYSRVKEGRGGCGRTLTAEYVRAMLLVGGVHLCDDLCDGKDA